MWTDRGRAARVQPPRLTVVTEEGAIVQGFQKHACQRKESSAAPPVDPGQAERPSVPPATSRRRRKDTHVSGLGSNPKDPAPEPAAAPDSPSDDTGIKEVTT